MPYFCALLKSKIKEMISKLELATEVLKVLSNKNTKKVLDVFVNKQSECSLEEVSILSGVRSKILYRKLPVLVALGILSRTEEKLATYTLNKDVWSGINASITMFAVMNKKVKINIRA